MIVFDDGEPQHAPASARMVSTTIRSDGLVIDVHAHIGLSQGLDEMRRIHPDGTPRLVDRDGGHYFEYPTGVVNGPLPPGMVDLDRRIFDMDEAGVDLQVVSVRPQMFGHSIDPKLAARLAATQNEALVDTVARRSDRLHAMISLPLMDPKASVDEIRRSASNPLVRGVLLDSNIGGANLDEDRFDPIWTALSDTDMPILVHPYQADVAGMDRMMRYYLFNLIGNPLDSTIALASVVFGGVLDRFPALRWCFVHGGGYAPYQLARWDHGWRVRAEARVHLDETPSSRFGRLYFDSLTHSPAPLRMLAELVGWSQVMVGTDYPFDMGDSDPVASIDRLDLDEAARRGVLESNARRFLR